MQNAIEICNVCHSFKETEVLKQINLSVKKGEIFGLLGPSGAGKTTLINIITGQLHPSEGKSIIQGVDSTLLSGDEYKKIGIPAPDAVIYLAVDPEISQRLMAERYGGDESKMDIQERDTEYLARSRAAADYCARKLGWYRVECTKTVDGVKTIRTVEEIQKDILGYLKTVL